MTQLNELNGTYTLDPSHSRLGFVTRHAMVTKVRGSFDEYTGEAVIDGANPAASSLKVIISTASIRITVIDIMQIDLANHSAVNPVCLDSDRY